MARLFLAVVLVFLVLLALRALRQAVSAFFRNPSSDTRRPPAIEADMVRDPVCGAWVDRRIALAGRQEGRSVAVCSERCRSLLEKHS